MLLEPKHLILRLPQLILCPCNVRLRLGGVFCGFLELLIGSLQLGVGFTAALLQPRKLIGAGEDAGGPGRGAAGHGATCIEHLTIQRYNPEPVPMSSCNGNGAVHILGNGGSAQQIFHNVPILGIVADQITAKPHKAVFPVQPVFLKPASPDGGQR